ncbi:putative DNA polymerase III subunit chi [Burkholderiales bacterium]|jgi:DNA polymerase-3 subunit chi|nr:putative DNA polymerase III subunit chi [Burkholderiales bacterium]
MAGVPTIDFHFNVDHCVAYACRVVRKARSADKTVLVFSRDDERLSRLDLALWTFSALDFLPHVGLPSPLAAATPIWLSPTQPDGQRDLLLLLDDEPAPQFKTWFPRFERVIDVVSTDPADRARARTRFKTYRDAGFTPVAHEIGMP